MSTFEEYVEGTTGNAEDVLTRYEPFIKVLRTLNACYERLLPSLTSTGEGTSVFVAMSHAAFLAAVKLAVSGELPPAYMVFRGCLEDALYGFFLFHHRELRSVWMARQDSEETKKKVRKEFAIGTMRGFLTEKNPAVGEQFGIAYETTIDFGAHPNTLAFTSHLAQIPESTDQTWQYINLTPVDQAMAFRIGAMAGLNALDMFALLFPDQFKETDAASLLVQGHREFAQVPEPGTAAEQVAAGKRAVTRSTWHLPLLLVGLATLVGPLIALKYR